MYFQGLHKSEEEANNMKFIEFVRIRLLRFQKNDFKMKTLRDIYNG